MASTTTKGPNVHMGEFPSPDKGHIYLEDTGDYSDSEENDNLKIEADRSGNAVAKRTHKHK
jgi:hypothetical protein